MRILFIVPRFLPELGGVQRHTYNVAENLSKEGCQVTILTCTYTKALEPIEAVDGLHIHRKIFSSRNENKFIETLLSTQKMWIFFLKNFRIISNQDIIHLHDYPTFLWIAPLIPLLRKPIFITFHGFEGYRIPTLSKVIRKVAEKMAKGNICMGRFIAKWYGTEPDYVLLGGVDIPKLSTGSHTEESAVFIGRLAKDTDIMKFMTTLMILSKIYGINLPLHICGDGPLRSQVEEYAFHNNLKVFLHGFIDNPQSYIIKCRYVFVSGYLSILEAMSYRRPIFTIYSNPLKKDYLYSIPNVENMMFVASSPEELAEKFHSVVKHPEIIDSMLERAYSFVKELTWINVANTYLELYKKRNCCNQSEQSKHH